MLNKNCSVYFLNICCGSFPASVYSYNFEYVCLITIMSIAVAFYLFYYILKASTLFQSQAETEVSNSVRDLIKTMS